MWDVYRLSPWYILPTFLSSKVICWLLYSIQQQQQQQQQQSLLSQASWGRLEMKPKRHKGHGSGTLIASLQALLSKASSSEISQSLRSGFYIPCT